MFSVVIPVYNHAIYLREAICSALQSPLVAEVLLLDDGSADGSRELAAELAASDNRIRDLTPPSGGNRGAHHCLNELAVASRCDWIAVLNSDDVFVPGRFEEIAGQPEFEESEFVFGHLLFVNQHSQMIGGKRGPFDTDVPFPPSFDVAALVAEKRFLELLAHQNFLGSTSNMVFRKRLHARIGGFKDYRYVHDWDFGLRAAAVGRPLYIQSYLTAYRLHYQNTISEDSEKVYRETSELFGRFAVDFPQQVSTPAFRAALEANVCLISSATADPQARSDVTRGEGRAEGRSRPGRAMEIGICGTFDVANYGDLLFPIIAEAELRDRLGEVTLHRFSYHAKKTPDWPFEVTSVSALPHVIHRLDGLLIGGGHLIRFDKDIAPGYVPPTPEIHHPTGYWLTPALIALQRGVPVVWNAPSGGNESPKWAQPLMEKAFRLSGYVSVRDEASREAIELIARKPVSVVPDTVFGLPRLLNLTDAPSRDFTQLCQAAGLDGPYIVIQAAPGLEGFVRFVQKNSEGLGNLRFLILPISPVLGDRTEIVDADPPRTVHLPYWPDPLVLAELIGRSEGVVGFSYHLTVTALVSGVPAFRPLNRFDGKYSALRDFGGIFELPPNGEPDVDWFLSRMGRTEPSAAVRAAQQSLAEHWDRIAAAIRAEPAATTPAVDRFWQSLPTLLEDAEKREDNALSRAADADQRIAQLESRLGEVVAQLTASRAEASARGARVAELASSLSWKVTAPLRFLARPLRKQKRPLLRLARIRDHRLETDPYRWAAITGLFSSRDAARLVATYPHDHFKRLSSYGGERTYEYEARSLIGMGSGVISFAEDLSDEWRGLASDLLNPEYRVAMSALTGYDLSEAPMEVNVFHYGPGGALDAHRDLPEKLATHVLYFNRSWNDADGGCLRILRSNDTEDMVAEISPTIGNSSVIVRSENSWHCVSRVTGNAVTSRRSITVTFYRPGSVSTMWPPGDTPPLHRYDPSGLR